MLGNEEQSTKIISQSVSALQGQKMNIDAKVLESFMNRPSCSRPVKENLIAPHGE